MTESGEEERRGRPGGTGEDMHPDTDPARGTSPIADDAEEGQTQTPASEDDVGVPDEVEDRTE